MALGGHDWTHGWDGRWDEIGGVHIAKGVECTKQLKYMISICKALKIGRLHIMYRERERGIASSAKTMKYIPSFYVPLHRLFSIPLTR